MKNNCKKSKLKSILCVVLALICVAAAFTPIAVYADVVGDLEDKRDELDQGIKENEEKLEQVEDEINTNENKLDKIKAEIAEIDSELSDIENKISNINSDINSINVNIETLSAEIIAIDNAIVDIEEQIVNCEALMEETKNQILNRLRENYIAGGGSSLEIIFTSDNLSSFLARKELVERISERDTQLMMDLETKIVELNSNEVKLQEQKTALETKKEELKASMANLEERQADLEENLTVQEEKKKEAGEKHEEIQNVINELDKDSEEYKKEIERQKKERDEIDRQIDDYIKQHGSTQGDKPDDNYNNDGKMLWPVPGQTRLTATYPSYSDGSRHNGIDIVRTDVTTKGSPFRAAQGGKVIIAKNDGAWNYGFGNYVVIDHGDGTQTLYAHAQKVNVKVGDVVQKGETIGLIGSTGNSTGPHLHFEVRVKRGDSVSRVNPLDYVSKP